ncbi:REP-associated tyrosine transposase [Echinicola rosea]|uniref:Transposase n=1 Tax=Echinicola rosea TaxID=1807691 RepID=A0ABQ1UNK3_9BACT|nr:transposase [Echinicola rosea]GGF23310.1 transposase [Echinicola rosea]
MSGDAYFITDQHAPYFLTLTVVDWVDIFTRKTYKDIIIDSFRYCQYHKGLRLHSWVIMSNHIHFIAYCTPPFMMSNFLRDFKKFTAKKIISAIQEIPESRKTWLLDRFSFHAKNSARHQQFRLWKEGNHAIHLQAYYIDIFQKINYIHNNSVKAGIVEYPENYLYSSAKDYMTNEKGLLPVELV